MRGRPKPRIVLPTMPAGPLAVSELKFSNCALCLDGFNELHSQLEATEGAERVRVRDWLETLHGHPFIAGHLPRTVECHECHRVGAMVEAGISDPMSRWDG